MLTRASDGIDAFSDLATNGWTIVNWPESHPLRDLASLILSVSPRHRMYRPGNSMRLIAMTKHNARRGGKSSIRGMAAFPPHTDAAWRFVPPRYILLRSISGQSNSPTSIFYCDISKINNHLYSLLASGLWACRGPRVSRIFSVLGGKLIRWDEDCMRPLDSSAKQAQLEFKEYINSMKKLRHEWSDKSTVLLIDNWNTLHARSDVETDEYRELERLYVEVA